MMWMPLGPIFPLWGRVSSLEPASGAGSRAASLAHAHVRWCAAWKDDPLLHAGNYLSEIKGFAPYCQDLQAPHAGKLIKHPDLNESGFATDAGPTVSPRD